MTAETAGIDRTEWWVPTFRVHRRLLLVLVGVGVLIAIGVAPLGFFGWGFVAGLLSVLFVVFVAFPAFVLMLVFWRTRRRYFTITAAVCASIVLLGVLLVPANVAGHFAEKRQIRRSKRQAEVIAGRLYRYHLLFSRYPRDLDALARLDRREVRLPRFAATNFYSVDNDLERYWLAIEEPDIFPPRHVYDSATREWTYETFD